MFTKESFILLLIILILGVVAWGFVEYFDVIVKIVLAVVFFKGMSSLSSIESQMAAQTNFLNEVTNLLREQNQLLKKIAPPPR